MSSTLRSLLANTLPAGMWEAGAEGRDNELLGPGRTSLRTTLSRAAETWWNGGLINGGLQAARYVGTTASHNLSLSFMGEQEYLLHAPGLLFPNSTWARIMNNPIERDFANGDMWRPDGKASDMAKLLIKDEFGPNAEKEFGDLPAAAQRMMIFQAQLNRAERINKAMTDRIQKIHSMLMAIIQNFKG